MKNLKLYSELESHIKLQSIDEVIQFSAFDIERNRLFFASSANLIYTTHFSSFQNGKANSKTSLASQVDPINLEPGDFITSFDYVMEKEALIVGTSNGLLLLHNLDDDQMEVVGRVEGGVKCISLSPDGDLLSVVTGFGQVLMMTHDWDLLYETAVEDMPEDVDLSESTSPSSYRFESSISWRGDGKYFATLSHVYNPISVHKKLKIWERDTGASHSVTELKAFAGTVLDWMPSGAKIAAAYDRKSDNKCPSIVFFERNGLERSSFSIKEPMNATVELLKWNCSSELLLSVVRNENYDSVKIWFFSNNHWYLKHEIRYPRQDGVRLMWNPTKPLQLICWTVGGQVAVYNFVWVTAVVEHSVALVVDDSKLLVTPLSLSLMPPPMYLFNLTFPSAIREIAFYSKNSKNLLAAYLADGCLSVVELPALDAWEELEGKEFIAEASSFEIVCGPFVHLIWLDSHRLLGVSHNGFGGSNYYSHNLSSEDGISGYYLQEIEVKCAEDRLSGLPTSSGWQTQISNQISVEGLIISLSPNPTKCSAFVEFDGGMIFEYASNVGRGALEQDSSRFSSSCPWMNVVQVSDKGHLKPLVFGLDDIGRLQISGKIICNSCSSFSFFSNLADQVVTHLILATKQDLLFIVDIDDILDGELELKYENFIHVATRRKEKDSGSFINMWERGAKVVGVLHGDEAAVILQTTRGNLECIYPRKLVLTSIANALVQGRFRDAIHMVRRHRIDFNVIVDHCGWQNFIQSASEFVRQVNNLGYLTEFVCAMKNENVTETLYKNFMSVLCLNEAKNVQESDGGNKVSAVLLAIRKALEEHVAESPARELCILTTLARSDPPALEEALERIKVIREVELLGSDDLRRVSYPSAEAALKHLLWLSDSEPVYDAAIGLYDLKLAAIVALNSQLDPKEFLPYLQQLETMPLPLMCYNIDIRLQRYEKALKHIISAGDTHYEDCMNLMKKNPQLFPLGLQLIPDSAKRREVLEAWGDHLSDEKCFDEAAKTYLCCSNLEKALKAYRDCGNWGGVLTVAGLLKLGKDEIRQLALDLCEELQALGKPGEAAKVSLEYCGDVNCGVSLLINARDWEEAIRVAFMHKREDLVLEVKNAALECASVLRSEYEEGLEKVGKYLALYLAVRQRRLLLAAKLQLEERSIDVLDDDTASESSSNFSGMSAYTTGTRKSISSSATSKTRERRRQRKTGKIRPGSPGEELALVEHLKSMSLTAGARHELKTLLVTLMMLGEELIARKLQRTAENFQLSQASAVKLAEDTVSTDTIDDQAHTLEKYVQKVGSEVKNSEELSWRPVVFISL